MCIAVILKISQKRSNTYIRQSISYTAVTKDSSSVSKHLLSYHIILKCHWILSAMEHNVRHERLKLGFKASFIFSHFWILLAMQQNLIARFKLSFKASFVIFLIALTFHWTLFRNGSSNFWYERFKLSCKVLLIFFKFFWHFFESYQQ